MGWGQVIRLGAAACVAALLGGRAEAADLTVGANVGNVPWEFQDASGAYVGFEVDLVRKVAEGLGKTGEFVNIPFNGLFPAVQSGRIDAAPAFDQESFHRAGPVIACTTVTTRS